MADRRKKILKNLLKNNPTETEQRMLNLVLERICADMADFYQKFIKHGRPTQKDPEELAKEQSNRD